MSMLAEFAGQAAGSIDAETPVMQRVLDASARCVVRAGGVKAAVPLEFEARSRAMPSGELSLRNWRWQLDAQGSEFYAVRVCSPKVDIVTQFLYPAPRFDLPVFAMEFVLLGSRPIVAVIDAVCLAAKSQVESATRAELQAAHRRWPEFGQANDAPAWFEDCRSGDDFFVRPAAASDFEALADAQHAVLDGVLKLHAQVAEHTNAASHASRIHDYKHHHADNSPGLPLMQRSFGAQWTHDYMRQYLFR